MTHVEKENLRFAVCISNDNYPASLEVGKLYQVIPDAVAESHGYIRVIDESGEDYGYSKDRFFSHRNSCYFAESLTESGLANGAWRLPSCSS